MAAAPRATPTRRPVTISPPAASSSATSASATASDPAPDHRPADRVGERREDQPERGAQRAIEAEHRMRRDAREQRPGGLVPEPAAGETGGDRSAGSPNLASASGWRGTWTPAAGSRAPIFAASADDRSEQPAPGPPVDRAEAGRGRCDRALEHRRAATVERVTRPARPDGRARRPRAARSIVAKNGEAERQRQDRRADVVTEARAGSAPRSAARRPARSAAS